MGGQSETNLGRSRIVVLEGEEWRGVGCVLEGASLRAVIFTAASEDHTSRRFSQKYA